MPLSFFLLFFGKDVTFKGLRSLLNGFGFFALAHTYNAQKPYGFQVHTFYATGLQGAARHRSSGSGGRGSKLHLGTLDGHQLQGLRASELRLGLQAHLTIISSEKNSIY